MSGWKAARTVVEAIVEQPDTRLDEELRRGAQYLAHRLTPTAGTIPRIPGIDTHGVSLPLNGVAAGDLITYVDFQERFDLDSRVRRAVSLGQEDTWHGSFSNSSIPADCRKHESGLRSCSAAVG